MTANRCRCRARNGSPGTLCRNCQQMIPTDAEQAQREAWAKAGKPERRK